MDDAGQARKDCERWDSHNNTWTVYPLLSQRANAMAFTMGSIIVLVGGSDLKVANPNLEFLDWESANYSIRSAPWLSGVRAGASITQTDTTLVIAGGMNGRPPFEVTSLVEYATDCGFGTFVGFSTRCAGASDG
jgi:hypothetical protein